MNDQPSPFGHMDDERRSSSPKRKKIRQKYAPKACVSCRRSKLKCSGENPCQRCIDNGKRCFYSEDQTAAEALQNLSRPTPAQQPLSSLTNGNGLSRRNIMPRHESTERRASDASVLSMTMETRMARIESMMEALIHERGMAMTPMGSIERENSNEGLRSDAAFALPLLDPINPALAQMEQQSNIPYESPDWRHPLPQFEDHSNSAEPPVTIRLGSRALPFPRLIDYRKYMSQFFGDLHLRHPCIEESEFRAFGERILAIGVVQTGDVFFLALNYAIFACCEVLLETSPRSPSGKPNGWHWFQIADDLVDKRTLLTGPGDLALIQLLLFQALYLKFADVPSSAYTTIGLASRLVFQYGLHQQRSLSHLDPEQLYTHVCVFWNVFAADRCISLSCGRPYSIREKDINIELPMDVFNKVLLHRQPPFESDPRHYINLYMNYTTLLAHRAGYIWDTSIVARSPNSRLDGDSIAIIDAQISHFLTNELTTMHIPHPRGMQSNAYNKTAMLLNNNNITLLLRHREMTSLQYDGNCAQEFGGLALDSMSHLSGFIDTAQNASPTPKHRSFRHNMTSSVAGALLILCALLVRDLSAPDLNLQHNYPAYVNGFQDGFAMLDMLRYKSSYARRVLEEFASLRGVVATLIQEFTPDRQIQGGFQHVEALLPPNIADLFPYHTLTPSLQALTSSPGEPTLPVGQDSSAWDNVEPSISGGGVLWL
ncbi:uncharacterized protein K460DRAFT_390909 [Cucurbitaria berberidis CBS 394.84]|uniref:Zn(2)-C6 fungal-type domain-containing protein n=1 Tax=Cucurbitaria berberidis CBS 394.84 TaxID=1168544 RepID=A0A9P4GRG7_9PLEO|nr:uncharacterized protein K460DRAFT_390909 [Cucurbitaria berberidis CBS 394.84]KAF1850395.1 hypothetical protein K460DRAFT_390909 [Cucurbitaria berberidis CBS 394.84]